MIATLERTALYRILGEADLLLYIGISNNFGRRWQDEAREFPWWDEHRRMTVEWYPSRPEAEEAEIAAIRAEHPKYNKRHAVPALRRSVKPRAIRTALTVVAELPHRPARDDESCPVPYPYSLLAFTLPDDVVDGIDLSAPDGRFQAAKMLGAYEKKALEIRSCLERHATGALGMEQEPDMQWAIPALRQIRRNCTALMGDGSSVDMSMRRAADIMRDTRDLSLRLAAAMGSVADAMVAVGEVREAVA